MRIKTTIILALDTAMDFIYALLPFLPGDRNSPGSLEARAAKAVDGFNTKLQAEAEHMGAVVERAQVKAEAIVTNAIATAAALTDQLEKLANSRLVKVDDRFTQTVMGLGTAGQHPSINVQLTPADPPA